jgi:hypothetical protein
LAPGISRAAIPVLKRAGVTAISVGVNTASMYPRVPKIFRWQDEGSAEEIFAMWHSRGYGGFSVSEAVRVKGLSHVLVTDWNGDNRGPSDAATIKSRLQAIQKEFPNATVIVSTFDNFTSLLEPEAVKQNIPIISQEIADTWIYVRAQLEKSAVLRSIVAIVAVIYRSCASITYAVLSCTSPGTCDRGHPAIQSSKAKCVQ